MEPDVMGWNMRMVWRRRQRYWHALRHTFQGKDGICLDREDVSCPRTRSRYVQHSSEKFVGVDDAKCVCKCNGGYGHLFGPKQNDCRHGSVPLAECIHGGCHRAFARTEGRRELFG
jgi:hypothetical protein